MKAREVIARLTKEGWILKSTKGSHMQYVHPIKSGKVTVPNHGAADITKGTLHSIYKQAGWK